MNKNKIQIGADKRTLEKNGEQFFYLADTIWSAFTNLTDEEWEFYLDKRASQGFNVLQINTLPQWDRGWVEAPYYPFPTEDGAKFSFTTIQEDYFSHARKMCQVAVEKGFTLALVLLWANYVPGTWASELLADNIIPYEFLEPLIHKQYETFDEFNPIYIVSGDTGFDTDISIQYYKKAMDIICNLSKDTLKTLHIRGRYNQIPDSLVKDTDFFFYQSGHNSLHRDMPYTLAESFYQDYAVKPIINSEPCYEQMGYSGNVYGRFNREDVRRAAWQSVLSGATAGLTYGAHGVWNWFKKNKQVNPVLGEAFDDPLPWQEALMLPGAGDFGYIRFFFEQVVKEGLTPSDFLVNDSKEIRMASNTDHSKYYIYLPCNTEVKLRETFCDAKIYIIDLDTHNIYYSSSYQKDGITCIPMHNGKKDALIMIHCG